MICKRLLLLLSVALLLLPVFGYGLDGEQVHELNKLLLRYEQNETRLSNELATLQRNLVKLRLESEISEQKLQKQIDAIESSLIRSEWQVIALQRSLESIGQSIETLELSLQVAERNKKIYKYGFFAAASAILLLTK